MVEFDFSHARQILNIGKSSVRASLLNNLLGLLGDKLAST